MGGANFYTGNFFRNKRLLSALERRNFLHFDNLESLWKYLQGNIYNFNFSKYIIVFAVVILIGLFLLIIIRLLLTFIKSIARFAFLQMVIDPRCSINSALKNSLLPGLSLFVWELAFKIITIFCLALVYAPIIIMVLQNMSISLILPILLVILTVFTIIIAIVILLLHIFLEDFVIPVMLIEQRGILSAWGRVLNLLFSNGLTTISYLFIRFIINLAAAIISGIALFIIFLVCLIIFGIPIALILAGCFFIGKVFIIILIFAGTIALILAPILIGFINSLVVLPIGVFKRTYSLKILGYLDSKLALLPEPPSI